MGKVSVIKASAGSGKTFRLAYEYIYRVVCEPHKYRCILAVTFTNKATEEMKRRILSELDRLARGTDTPYMAMLTGQTGYSREQVSKRAMAARTKILHDYSRFAVLTIDKFFQRIIRSFVKELGIDLNFNLELQTDSLVSKTADALIERIGQDEQLRKWITGYIEERIDSNMRWDIKSGLVAIGQELFRENFRKIAAGVPEMDVIRTVLRTAAGKYNRTVKEMTAHAVEALEINSSSGLAPEDFVYGRGGVGGYLLKVSQGRIEDYGPRVEKALESDEGWCSKKSELRETILNVAPYLREKLAAICATYENNRRFFATYELLRDDYRRFALLGSLARVMEEICTEESIMPISETNNILGKLISGNDSPFIFEKAGNHFDTFMIDEFQDTSSMQWENFKPLLHNAVSQAEGSPVLLVGDVKQSIYRWRGGDWKILAEGVEMAFGDPGSETLSQNWRSRPAVVDFNNRLIGDIVGHAAKMISDTLREAQAKGLLPAGKLAQLNGLITNAYREHSQQACGNKEGGYVTVTYYGTGEQEVIPPVIRRIEQLQDRGFQAGDIAVLVRRNSEGVEIADMLLGHKVANPGSPYCYDVVTQEALSIGASPVVNFVIACFRLAQGDERIPEKVFYNSYLDREFGQAVPVPEQEFIRSLRSIPTIEAFDETVIFYGLGTPANAAYLQALHDQILGWTATHVGDTPLFVKWWDETGAGQSVNVSGNGNAITIVSIHKSKGLEYPAVIIPYCDWSLSPHPRSLIWSHSADEEFGALGNVPVAYGEKMGRSHFSESYYEELVMSVVDNINLFYVAATRARDELHIMVPGIPKNPMKISSLIYTSLDPAGMADGFNGVSENLPGETVIKFGTPVNKDNRGESEQGETGLIRLPFDTRPTSGRIRQKRTYRRFEEDGVNPAITPRDHGILLHKVFEKAVTREDIIAAVRSLELDGVVTTVEKTRLDEMVRQAFENPVVAAWFESDWQHVYNERDILIPGASSRRRPDRVMVSDEEVVVVDYKFGEIRDPAHLKQVSFYKSLLGKMTGKPTRAYIWYVTLNEVAEAA
ncbi:MAG: UvrD-helicase domain-containing protein [Alistipes sp.]|nr:UvrD-helicase domain-containing protein [Alistipes sp.]